MLVHICAVYLFSITYQKGSKNKKKKKKKLKMEVVVSNSVMN